MLFLWHLPFSADICVTVDDTRTTTTFLILTNYPLKNNEIQNSIKIITTVVRVSSTVTQISAENGRCHKNNMKLTEPPI
jgi:hypothetical protein